MPEAQSKRKNDSTHEGSTFKKRKEGTGGRWKTPAHKAKQAEKVEMGTALDVGDEGIWVTYARGMKGKAVREFKELCEEYGEKMYGIKAPSGEDERNQNGENDDEDDHDIEASIQQELSDMKAPQKPKSRQVFSPVSAGIECVFFMKTMKPVEPDELVRKICEDARDCPNPMQRKCRYINRLTPVMDMDKATEKGIQRVARNVLGRWFNLKDETEGSEDDTSKAGAAARQTQPDAGTSPITYAIRHNIRNHTVFKSDAVIKMIAGMVKPEHKVNLGNPDKVILVEIFQLFCGISVVDGKEWEELKRYNINGLYGMTAQQKSGGGGGGRSKNTEAKGSP